VPYALSALLLSLAVSQAPSQEGREGTAILDPVHEARVQRLGKLLRCAVCQGVSIADSPASMARAQLDKVRELVSQEKSDEEIFGYFVDRYGEWALMEPRKGGVTMGLWLFPVLLLVIGGAIIVASAKGKQAAPVAPAAGGAQATTTTAAPDTDKPADDAFLAQVRADLEREK
jgi:cytochrome c-type biogenesis protein CcmH